MENKSIKRLKWGLQGLHVLKVSAIHLEESGKNIKQGTKDSAWIKRLFLVPMERLYFKKLIFPVLPPMAEFVFGEGW